MDVGVTVTFESSVCGGGATAGRRGHHPDGSPSPPRRFRHREKKESYLPDLEIIIIID